VQVNVRAIEVDQQESVQRDEKTGKTGGFRSTE
ncbi:hypothetical protein MEC_01306, partial [Bartonella alsatica IBS 382]